MDSSFRERLRLVISVALTTAPRAVKKAFADRYDERQQDSARRLSQAAADAVLQSYDVSEKPLPAPGRGVPSRPD
jgi:hypothetical protein